MYMSNPIEQSYEAMQRELALERQRDRDEEARKLAIEKENVDGSYETHLAATEAEAEREKTFDWAWATAEYLNESGIDPETWKYEYTQRTGLFGLGQRALQGIATEGWTLLDWQNTYYRRDPKHTLILTPKAEDNSGVHLSYFSHPVKEGQAPYILPEDVHELPRTPLSPDDMPWPTSKETPWAQSRSMEFSETISKNGVYDLADDAQGFAPHELTAADYEAYKKRGIEDSMRKAIVQVAAKYISLTPEAVAERAQDHRPKN